MGVYLYHFISLNPLKISFTRLFFYKKYIGRYLSRAPIAEYRIVDTRDNKVTFYYENLADNKKRTELTLDIETFLAKLIIHIPPKHFKMIICFGIYSRNINSRLKFIMKSMQKYVSKYSKTIFYQYEIWKTFEVNPFYYFKCNIKMKFKKYPIIIFIQAPFAGKNTVKRLI